MEVQKVKHVLKKEIDWSLRYLGIYNLSKNRAQEIIDKIILELSYFNWENCTYIMLNKNYLNKLKLEIIEIKQGV